MQSYLMNSPTQEYTRDPDIQALTARRLQCSGVYMESLYTVCFFKSLKSDVIFGPPNPKPETVIYLSLECAHGHGLDQSFRFGIHDFGFWRQDLGIKAWV